MRYKAVCAIWCVVCAIWRVASDGRRVMQGSQEAGHMRHRRQGTGGAGGAGGAGGTGPARVRFAPSALAAHEVHTLVT